MGDVRMIECREYLRFPSEPGEAVGIVDEALRQDLQRDVASELCVLGAIDLAHPARAEGRQDFVSTEPRAGRERHSDLMRSRLSAPLTFGINADPGWWGSRTGDSR